LALVRWYVDAAATGANTGEDWENAMVSLQETLMMAFPDDEVWVARGTYLPTDGIDCVPDTCRTFSFELLDRMSVYGGFAGFETTIEQRNPRANWTILSGDIGENSDASDNSYHVVRIRSEALQGTLDGFTITDGNADGDFNDNNRGGGIFNHGMYTIENCRINGNSAEEGGGIYTSSNGLIISNSDISGNVARGVGGGGGISADGSLYGPGDVTLTDTTLAGNRALSGNGGGISNRGETDLIRVVMIENSALEERGGAVFSASERVNGMTITDSEFHENVTGEDDGGAVYNALKMTISGTTFMNNNAGGKGGAIANAGTLTVLDSTIDQNFARHGGGVHNSGELVIGGSTISRNQTIDAGAGLGGGLYNEMGGTTFTNGTISTNTAASGGGVYSTGQSLLFDHATIAFNDSTASLAGGIATLTPATWLLHSLVATNTRNTDEGGIADDVSGNFDQNSEFNLVGAGDDASGISHGVHNNQVGSTAFPIAPLLGQLADNGGPAKTHLPLAGSPAIDAGDPNFTPGMGNPPVETDQRGLDRIIDGDGNAVARIDIGSVEAPEGSGPTLPCDLDNDGHIGLRDLILLRNNLGLSGEFLTRRHGDFDDNFVVDLADVAIFMTHYGSTTQAPSPAAVVVEQGSGVGDQGSGVGGQGSGGRGQNDRRDEMRPMVATRRTAVRTPNATGVDRVMSRESTDVSRPLGLRASRGRAPRATTPRFDE
jgi:predicted outer membrane repeat protein